MADRGWLQLGREKTFVFRLQGLLVLPIVRQLDGRRDDFIWGFIGKLFYKVRKFPIVFKVIDQWLANDCIAQAKASAELG